MDNFYKIFFIIILDIYKNCASDYIYNYIRALTWSFRWIRELSYL